MLLLLPAAAAVVPHVVQAPGDEPVWRQVLRLHLDHKKKSVVRTAAAALEAE